MMLTPVATHETTWDPKQVSVPLCVSLDACFVPISTGGVRLDTANIVVLDDFISEGERQELLDYITHSGWDHAQGPPSDRWEKATSDAADQPRTWGLKGEVLRQLSSSQMRAKVEVQSRLCKLYPEVIWCHQPSDAIQQSAVPSEKPAEAYQGSCTNAAEGVQGQHQERTGAAGSSYQGQGGGCPTPPEDSHACQQASNMGSGLSSHTCQQAGNRGLDAPALSSHSCQQGGNMGSVVRSAMASNVGPGAPVPSSLTCSTTPHQGQGSRDNAPVWSQSDSHRELRGGPPASRHGVHPEGTDADSEDSDGGLGASCTEEGRTFDCSSMLANAATHGDKFGWHQDADPMTFPPSLFTSKYGWYANREPGKPLFVSLILYLNNSWPKEWDAETLFLDVPSDTGILVRPKAYRAVLMDQDVLHRLSQPSHHAGRHPRYSLVWKLVMLPRSPGQQCCIARAEWGPPTCFGSSAKADAVVRQMARKRKAAEPAQ